MPLSKGSFSRAPDKSTSKDISTSTGRIAWDRGMSVLVKGSEAISEINRAVARSVISSSPNWRFPIKRMVMIKIA